MKSKFYIVSLAAILTACSSPETDTVVTETSESSSTALQTEKSVEMAKAETSASEKSNDADPSIRQVDAHIHGGATLAIAVDGKTVTAELETPLYNLLGFEHEPETDEQKDAVEKVEKQLSEPSALISFNEEAGCKALPVSLKTELFDHDDHHEGDNIPTIGTSLSPIDSHVMRRKIYRA